MTRALCGLVLAAGEGRRLRPLTERVPKALAPVGNVALLDRALHRLARHRLAGPGMVAVNACYLADQVADHVGARAYLSREPGPPALGTAGAVARLREWINGRAVLVGNADAFLCPSDAGPDLAPLLDGWDGTTVRVLTVPAGDRPAEFGDRRFAGFSLLPADVAAGLPDGAGELVLRAWRPAERDGRLELCGYEGAYYDVGTPPDYLAANLLAADNANLIATDAVVTGRVTHSVVGAGARVDGETLRCVVLPNAVVGPDESLVDAVRVGDDLTISVR